MQRRFETYRWAALALSAALLFATSAHGYVFTDGSRWSRTATDGSGLVQGDPTTVTWSIAPDGTTIPNNDGSNGTAPSSLISFLDAIYPGGSGSDLTQRAWFYMIDQSFKRWEELSGLTFVYEDDDDGASFSGLNIRRGILNTRGDIRLGATAIDGQDGSNTLAFAIGPDYGEVVMDSDNTALFGNSFNDYRAPRNVLTHEIGHALGINHVYSSNAVFLMEPNLNVSFDGPQLDDILAIHRGYGDRYEKTNNASGNETPANATALGLVIDAVTTSIGTDANDTVVARTDTDFVSIDDNSDIDYFSFTVDARAELSLTLTPMGPTYKSGSADNTQSDLNTAALSDLTLALFNTNGTSLIAQANNSGAGSAESIMGVLLESPGTYFVRITGSDNAPQLYQLDVLVSSIPPMPGDLDGDFDVDGDDLAIVLNNYNTAVTPGSLADGDPTGDGQVAIADIERVLANWTGTPPANLTVPEPASLSVLVIGWMAVRRRRGI